MICEKMSILEVMSAAAILVFKGIVLIMIDLDWIGCLTL